MTAVTVVVDKDKKLQYKDYVQFLGSYKNGKKNESDFSYSSSSLVSDLSDESDMPTKSFSEYLQNYNDKKYQPVQPVFNKKPDETKNMKTEVFIQINNTNNDTIQITIPKPDETDGEKAKVSVGRLSQKFNNSSIHNDYKITTQPLQRSSSIKEKTKIFEEKSETRVNKTNYNEKYPKKIAGPKKNNAPKTNATFVEIRKQELLQNDCSRIPLPPFIPPTKDVNYTPVISSSDIFIAVESNKIDSSMIKPNENKPVIPQENVIKAETNLVPPPPPLPPANLPPAPRFVKVQNSTPKPFSSSTLPKNVKTVRASDNQIDDKGQGNAYSTLPKIQNGVKDPNAVPVDKNDPRVKKIVYGALRDMYGAYHDKANDYLATLPKNRVKKGNGLDSIIDSIAAQGGLGKLCGRATPKNETDPQ